MFNNSPAALEKALIYLKNFFSRHTNSIYPGSAAMNNLYILDTHYIITKKKCYPSIYNVLTRASASGVRMRIIYAAGGTIVL